MIEKRFLIESDYSNVVRAAHEIAIFLCQNSVQKRICDEVEMCLIEALNNIVKHAYGVDKEKIIEVLAERSEEKLSFTLIDSGNSRKDLSEAKLDFDPSDINSIPESGMGLFIIENLMDTTAYQTKDGKNYYIMEKYLAGNKSNS